jgi:hypothetical protein
MAEKPLLRQGELIESREHRPGSRFFQSGRFGNKAAVDKSPLPEFLPPILGIKY